MTEYNGTEVQGMTYNGQEVDVWIHNGVEVYSGKVQLKYVVTVKKDNTGTHPVNVKIYSMKDESLVKNIDFTIVTNGGTANKPYSYNDGFIKLEWGSLIQNRWTFTPLVEGASTVEGVANRGDSCGGTADQFVPYVANADCIITFITTNKYKWNAVNIIAQPTSQTVNANEYANFSIVAVGNNLAYQWQYKLPTSEEWNNSSMTGSDTNSISVQGTTARNGYQYRCVVTDGNGKQAISFPATLTVK